MLDARQLIEYTKLDGGTTRGDIIKQIRLYAGFLSRILSTPWFPGLFAATYAIFLTLMMYPGILYTDSIFRWHFTLELFAGRPIDDFYPIAPYFLMGALHWLTGEIGIYTLTQSFLLSLGAFYLIFALVRPTTVGERALVSVVAVAVLLIPVQLVYAVFQSYDSAAATVMLWLSVVLVRLQQRIGRLSANLIAATILLALLVGFRLPAFPVAALALVGIFWVASTRCGRPVIFVGILPAMGLIASPFALGPLLHAYPSHSWIEGLAWRYMVATTEAKDPIHEAFLRQMEADVGRKRGSPPCYFNIYCSDYWPFIDRIREDQSTRKQAEANMLLMAREEPVLLARTYLTFAGRVLGVREPLANAEIGRWHDPKFTKGIEELGFQPNDRREAVVGAYNEWMDVGTGNFLLYPLYLLLGVGALTTLRWGLERQSLARRGLAIRCALPLFFGALYYITYIPISQSHELRYFYPTLLLLQVVTFSLAASLFMKKGLVTGFYPKFSKVFWSEAHITAPAKQLIGQRHFACLAAVILILVAPNAIWVLRDQSVWPWDQAGYGEWTLRIWQAKDDGPLGWLDAWLHVWGGRPPLIVWVGQFFVPFRHLSGSFESAMLMSNLAVATGTLILIYRLAREYSATWVETVVALLTCGGSSLFVGLTHQYLTELLQSFTTASMMCVAFRAERRPVIRTMLLMVIAASLSFAAKASSAPFVLPFLAYAILVLIITRGRARPAIERRDAVLFIAAVAIAAATVAWYEINWEATVAHFVEATTGPEALQYGSPVVLSTKLKFWISTLGVGLSPFTIISAATCIVIMVGIVLAVVRLWRAPVHDRIFVAMENGILFALVLAATILLTLLTFSLQINEDKRYALSLIPMVAVLLSWSLSVLRQKILTAVFLCALAASSFAVYSYSFNLYDPDDEDNPWNWQLQLDPHNARLLQTAVRASCPPENANRTNLFIVDYPNLNGHSANFYAEKDSYSMGYRCYYDELYALPESNIHTASDRLDALNALAAPYVITVAPDRQAPLDFTNVSTKDVTLFLARDPHYLLMTEPRDYLQIYRKIM